MRHELVVYDDVTALANAAAHYVSERAASVAHRREPFTLALSGGKSPWLMLEELARDEIDWSRVVLYQVDERVVPASSDLRNLTHILGCLSTTGATINAMDVEEADLNEASRRYAAGLPPTLDVIHLGLGPDGHCASLVPNDPVLDVEDRLTAVTGPYQDARRMTLTYPALATGDQLLWLVSGEDKQWALTKLLEGDESIPAGRVRAPHSLIMADRDAFPG